MAMAMDIQKELEREWGAAAFERSDEPYRDGFGLKAVLGGLFLGFIMLPGAIYLSLVAGDASGMSTAAQWVTVILFTEVARRCFTRLTRQEIYVLYALAGGLVVAGGPFFALIWNQYLVQSTAAEQFGLVKELAQNAWIAPEPASAVYRERSVFHHDWLAAIIVIVISGLLMRLNRFALGFALFKMTSDVEKLPFPMAPVAAQGATALAESYGEGAGGSSWRWRIFTIGSAIGILFGIVYVLVPTVTGGIMNKPVQIFPIPFIDYGPSTRNILPAALIGISTNFTAIVFGFVLPFWMVVGQFAASVIAQIVLNPIFYKAGVLHQWKPGMDTISTFIVNDLDLWLSVRIGTSLCMALLGVGLAFWTLWRRGIRGSGAGHNRERGDLPIGLAIALWLGSTAGLVYLCHRLVPDFPWWILAFFGFVWTPFNSYISARMMGLTGSGVEFSYFREGSFVLATRHLNYSGSAIWFAPIPLADWGGMAQFFQEMTLTRTKITSLIKVELLIFPLLLICSILFCSFLWKLNPIPSAAYPFAAKMWPVRAYFACLWASATRTGDSFLLQAINFSYVFMGLGAGLGLFLCFQLFGLPTLAFYGVLTGITSWPHYTVLLFAGAMLGRFVFAPRIGRDKWRSYVPVLAAGTACGLGLTGMLAIGFTLISRSVIQLSY